MEVRATYAEQNSVIAALKDAIDEEQGTVAERQFTLVGALEFETLTFINFEPICDITIRLTTA